MNIEEERNQMVKELVKRDCESEINKMCIASGDQIGLLYDAFFEVWLTAKAHAAEMAKPTARIVYKLLKSAEPETFGETLYDSEFGKLTCQQWAKDNGYRVIE